jgi:hypothetical protein
MGDDKEENLRVFWSMLQAAYRQFNVRTRYSVMKMTMLSSTKGCKLKGTAADVRHIGTVRPTCSRPTCNRPSDDIGASYKYEHLKKQSYKYEHLKQYGKTSLISWGSRQTSASYLEAEDEPSS